MPALSTTYLIPAILLNPAFILHLINTFASHLLPPSPPVASHSPHPFMESIGPVPGSTPYWDVHADDALCWRYTAIMVLVQVFAFGRVSDNRVARRERKAAAKERRRLESEALIQTDEETVESEKLEAKLGGDGAQDSSDEWLVSEKLDEDWKVKSLEGEEDLIAVTGPGTLSRRRPISVDSKETFIKRLARLSREIQLVDVPICPAKSTEKTPEKRDTLEDSESEASSTSEEEMII